MSVDFRWIAQEIERLFRARGRFLVSRVNCKRDDGLGCLTVRATVSGPFGPDGHRTVCRYIMGAPTQPGDWIVSRETFRAKVLEPMVSSFVKEAALGDGVDRSREAPRILWGK